MTTNQTRTILIATGNPGKVAEIRELFAQTSFSFMGLADMVGVSEVEEIGSTFRANAELKAAGYAMQTGLLSLADDSGLEVEALDGRPGVLSARYGGEGQSFSEKMRIVLDEMADAANASRKARFVCVMSLANERGKILFSAEGECQGVIAAEARGSGGFGYDPIFIPDGFEQTFGELPDTVKARISHRAKAADKIMRYLLDFIGIPT